jgi:hypothetical protein
MSEGSIVPLVHFRASASFGGGGEDVENHDRPARAGKISVEVVPITLVALAGSLYNLWRKSVGQGLMTRLRQEPNESGPQLLSRRGSWFLNANGALVSGQALSPAER